MTLKLESLINLEYLHISVVRVHKIYFGTMNRLRHCYCALNKFEFPNLEYLKFQKEYSPPSLNQNLFNIGQLTQLKWFL